MVKVKISQDYTQYLKNLKNTIIRVDSLKVYSAYKEEKNKSIEKLKELYNKLYLYQLYKDQMLISVTGFQGAGKTTFIRNYLGLPTDILPENVGRGERLPVFISTTDSEEIEIYYYKSEVIDGEIEIIREKVLKEEVEVISRDNDKQSLWMELKVPSNQAKVMNKGINFVLLPGYERLSTDFSQKFIDFAVNISTSSIIVLDKTTFSRKSTSNIIKKINNKFEDIKPVVVVTHGDENKEGNDSFKKLVEEKLKIDEPERIIITGPSDTFGDEWKVDLTTILNSYNDIKNNMDGDINESIRENTLQDILMDIKDELEILNDVIENMSKEMDIEELINSNSNTGDLFKKEYEKYLNMLEKKLTSRIQSYKKDKKDELASIVKQNSGFWKNLKVRLLGQDVEEEQKYKNKLIRLWEESSEDKKNALQILNYSADETLREYNNIYSLPNQVSDENRLLERAEDQQNSLVKIQTYLTNDNERTSLNNQDIKGLVYIGADFLTNSFKAMEIKENREKMAKVDRDLQIVDKENADDTLIINVTQETPDKEIQAFKDVGLKMKTVIPIVLGIDLASDGELDTLTNISNGMEQLSTSLTSIGFKVSSKTLMKFAGGAFLISMATYAVQQNIQDLNKRQMSIYRNSEIFIESLAQSQIFGYIDSLRNIFENMEEKLRYRHSHLKGENELFAQVDNCQYLLNRVMKNTTVMLEKYYEEKLLF